MPDHEWCEAMEPGTNFACGSRIHKIGAHSWEDHDRYVERLERELEVAVACEGDPIECSHAAALGELEEKVLRVRHAIVNSGPHPGYHKEQIKALRRNWPTLWNALDKLIG